MNTYIALPFGITLDLIKMIPHSSDVWKSMWETSLKNTLESPSLRKTYLETIAQQMDLFHAICAIECDPTVYVELVTFEKTRCHRPKKPPFLSKFCPVWAAFFSGRTISSHDYLLFRQKVGDYDTFVTWGFQNYNRLITSTNLLWKERFIGTDPKKSRLERQINAQMRRGRTKGPKGGDPSRRPL
jgi:hypothetical protein